MLFSSLRPGAMVGLAASAALCLSLLGTKSGADPISPDDFLHFDEAQARLGQLLFYDKILSGNRNISCGTCHHHDLNGTDGLSLGIGEGGKGLGPNRSPGTGAEIVTARIPRNAPALWNLGHRDVSVMFHDGRVEVGGPSGARLYTPAGALLPEGLNSVLAAQALFPPSSTDEMAGAPAENDISAAFAERIDLGWAALARRIRHIPEYERMFVSAFPHVQSAQDITISDIANAIASFVGNEWQSFDSPYDDFVSHGTPLDPLAEQGRQLFFGEARCVTCHNGPLFTDQDYYVVGTPQFGPGRPFDGDPVPHDLGRMETTRDPADAYRFRTPSLRNVALSAPYGHNGAFPTLRDMIRHMCDPITSRRNWTPGMARLPRVDGVTGDFAMLEDAEELARQVAFLDIEPVQMVEADIDALEAFLNALTGKTALTRPMGRPKAVPSGLPVD